MTTLAQADIFFFISSIGFVILGIVLATLMVFTIIAIRSFIRILDRIESSLDTIGDTTLDLIEDLQSNVFFRMLFHPKKRSRSKKIIDKTE